MLDIYLLTVIMIEDYLGTWIELGSNWTQKGFLVCTRVDENNFSMKRREEMESVHEILYTVKGTSIACYLRPSIKGTYTKDGSIEWVDVNEPDARATMWIRRGL